jgi:hypothetical protein
MTLTVVWLISIYPQPLTDFALKGFLDSTRDYWITMGVMEESDNLFRSMYSYEYDIGTVNYRQEQMRPDTPPFVAQHHLPPVEAAHYNLSAAIGYLQWLEIRQLWLIGGEENVLRRLIEEQKWRIRVWDAVTDSRSYYVGRDGRRLRMAALRDLIGQEAFDRSEFPTPLPPEAHHHYWSKWEDEDDDSH